MTPVSLQHRVELSNQAARMVGLSPSTMNGVLVRLRDRGLIAQSAQRARADHRNGGRA